MCNKIFSVSNQADC